jgi:hypothetical protein
MGEVRRPLWVEAEGCEGSRVELELVRTGPIRLRLVPRRSHLPRRSSGEGTRIVAPPGKEQESGCYPARDWI